MTDFEIRDKVTLLRDFLNNVGATASGVEVSVTQDADLGLRFFADQGNTEQHSVWWQDYLVPAWDACGWSTSSSNGGSGQAWESISEASNATGVNELRTNTRSDGMYAVLSWNNVLLFDNQTAYTFEGRFNVSALNDGSDTYVASFGFGNAFSSAYGAEADSCLFVYEPPGEDESHVWKCRTERNSTTTETVTAVAVVGDDSTFYRLKIAVPEDGSEVVYSINDTVVATHTTNIPNIYDKMGIGFRINKLTGTTNREMRVDWTRFTTTRTAAR